MLIWIIHFIPLVPTTISTLLLITQTNRLGSSFLGLLCHKSFTGIEETAWMFSMKCKLAVNHVIALHTTHCIVKFQICLSCFTGTCWMHTWWSLGRSVLLKTLLLFLLGLHCPYRREISVALSEKFHAELGQFNPQKNQLRFYSNSAFFVPHSPFQCKDWSCSSDSCQTPTWHLSLHTLPGFQADTGISFKLGATWCLKELTFTKRENILWLV